MEPLSRRTFFKQAGAVAALAGGAAVAPAAVGTAIAGATTTKDQPLKPEEDPRRNKDLVAHVMNTRTGEISLFVGEREVIIHDPTVAARLVRATR